MPIAKSAAADSARPASARAPRPVAAPRSRSWNPGVLIRELQRVDEITLVRSAIHAEQADARRNRRLPRPRRAALEPRQHLERALVADLAQRQRRIVLQRSVELRDRRNRLVGVLRLVVAERLDDDAAEKVLAATDFPDERRLHARVGAERGQCPDERRPDELRLLLLERCQELGDHGAIGIVFEEAVCDGPETIVRARQRLAHRVTGSRIVESGEEDQRPISNVAVGMLGDRLQQRGHRLGGGGSADGSRCRGPCVVVEIAELVDRGLQLVGGNRLWARGFLPATAHGSHCPGYRGHRGSSRPGHCRVVDVRPLRRADVTHRYFVTASLPSFNASCR